MGVGLDELMWRYTTWSIQDRESGDYVSSACANDAACVVDVCVGG